MRVVERLTAIKTDGRFFVQRVNHISGKSSDLFFLKGPCILTDAECIHPKR